MAMLTKSLNRFFPRAKLLSRGKQAMGVWIGNYCVGAIREVLSRKEPNEQYIPYPAL